jgi:hypothetical protein
MLLAMSTYVKDLIERIVATFVMAFLAVLVTAGQTDGLNVEVGEAAVVAGIAAVASLVKGLIAKHLGDTESASVAPGV